MRTAPLSLIAALSLLSSGPALADHHEEAAPKADTAAEAGTDRSSLPGPLAERPFTPPTAQTAALSNGLKVALVENHEVPLVYVRLVHNRGGWTDPGAKRGLASSAMDMLNEGAGGLSAEALASAQQRLGATIGSSANDDGGAVSLRALKRNLGPSLDLFASVVLQPDFPEADWDLLRKKRIQNLKAERDDPNSISGRVWQRLMVGDQYQGRLETAESYGSISTEDLKRWYQAQVTPGESLLLVGGDVTLAQVLPELEARFGSWTGAPTPESARPSTDALPSPATDVIYLVHKPGAAQSVVRVGTWVGDETDPDWFAFNLADRAIGGNFTARINMNLREDKGITYGARSGTAHSYLPGRWGASSSIVTESTALGVSEILREVREAQADRPITTEELESARGGLIGTWPLNFESPNYLLGETVDAWRYGLGDDWLGQLIPRYRAVTLDQANAAFADRIDPDALVILVVGDAEKVRGLLQKATGRTIVELDADGAPAKN